MDLLSRLLEKIGVGKDRLTEADKALLLSAADDTKRQLS